MKRLLIVRMSALGDIVHALPVLSAIRAAYPTAEVDWLVDRKYAGILDFVDGISRRIIGRPGLSKAVGVMRAREYDVALDLQGLLKSAAMARLSGATRVIGFEQHALREAAAAWFYGEQSPVPKGAHVVRKNLAVTALLGITPPAAPVFPFVIPVSAVADDVARRAEEAGCRGVALINPGAAWPNKRWSPSRFGQVAQFIRDEHRLAPMVLWGSGEAELADAVVAASNAAALRAPETSLGDLIALSSRAALMVSGDTGPVHIAAAVKTPIVGLYGPTWPERNGPWDPSDVVVSRAASCECHHKRRCVRTSSSRSDIAAAPLMCIDGIAVDEVTAAISKRLGRGREQRQ
jgi:lipopolysaccharide heptosyltransferase I